eukprot:TRINITY_DN23842_c0_g1_i1.p1 TRINITY_DN23842_c0_g1~~TRINITY_DN23842_c0_g1_i1.p1  ORF type:complete len:310 (-),score=68.08 TRINITY_DN23842_c0_g1_i1:24-953(-)
MAPRPGTVLLLAAVIIFMALKPMLLHSTRSAPLPGEFFQLGAEVLKLTLCALVLLVRRVLGKPAPLWCGWGHTVAFALPSAIYLLMNILTVHCARVLSPPIFQLVANTKILLTAVAAWALLARELTLAQWLSMGLLTVGVTLGQWQGAEAGDLEAPLVGVLLLVFNASLSALGGVCTERVLKGRASVDLSIFATNVHLAAHTLLLNGIVVWARGLPIPAVPDQWCTVALLNEAANGVLISLVMRHMDTISKNFAFSMSVFVTAGLSAAFLGFRPLPQFYAGAVITSTAVVLYTSLGASSQTPAQKDKKA